MYFVRTAVVTLYLLRRVELSVQNVGMSKLNNEWRCKVEYREEKNGYLFSGTLHTIVKVKNAHPQKQ
jgi:hypothetical protein